MRDMLSSVQKTVFISYCHKDVSAEWISDLAIKLGRHGIKTIADIYDLQLGQDIGYFTESLKKADKVFMLLGKEYKEKANEREGGVGKETQIISNDIYNDVNQTKFIPITIDKDENGDAYLPIYLESRYYIDFSDSDKMNKNMDKLIRQVYDRPIMDRPIVLPNIESIKKK